MKKPHLLTYSLTNLPQDAGWSRSMDLPRTPILENFYSPGAGRKEDPFEAEAQIGLEI